MTFIYVNCMSHCYNHNPSYMLDYIAWLEFPDGRQKLCVVLGCGEWLGQRKGEGKEGGDWEDVHGER